MGWQGSDRNAARTNTMSRFETETLTQEDNLKGLALMQWVELAMAHTPHRRSWTVRRVQCMVSRKEPPTGTSSVSAIIPSFCSTSLGIAKERRYGPETCIVPMAGRNSAGGDTRRKDCGCCSGVTLLLPSRSYTSIGTRKDRVPIRLPANQVIQEQIQPLLERPTEWPSREPIVSYHDFAYQAQSWHLPRRVVAKVEWHQGELFPRVGFIVTNLSYPPKGIVRFYNGRGTAEQWIKEGKYALNWTRLSCHKFVANQVRLWLFVLTYNLGNFMRRLVLPEDMKHWTLSSLQTRLIKTGGRLVRHARRLVFQLAEVLVTREMLTGILERISRLRLAPG